MLIRILKTKMNGEMFIFMKINEFAKAVGVSASLLRYYDERGILSPVEKNLFSGYRYYSEDQIELCKKIMLLKSAGFSLDEIKSITDKKADRQSFKEMFAQKRLRLDETARLLSEAEKIIMGGNFMNTKKHMPLHENVKLPFENDERVIGRWELADEDCGEVGGKKRELYFLPNGEWYWCYSWTKGKFLYNDGVSSCVSDYTLEERKDGY